MNRTCESDDHAAGARYKSEASREFTCDVIILRDAYTELFDMPLGTGITDLPQEQTTETLTPICTCDFYIIDCPYIVIDAL